MGWLGMLAIAVLATGSAGVGRAQGPPESFQINRQNRSIAITATDRVRAMADSAEVHAGFVAYGPDSDTAYAAGSRISNAVMKALTGAGVAADAIQSENQNLAPIQPYQQADKGTTEERARRFQVTQSWTVRTNAKDAARVLDLAVKAGANQSGEIEWTMADENVLETQAAARALQRARAVANEMAKGLSVTLGPLLFVSNQTQASPVRPMMRAMAGMAMKQEVAPLAINPREIERSATVYAVFAID